MRPAAELAGPASVAIEPPVGHSAWWVVLAVLLLVLVIAWYAVLLVRARRHRLLSSPPVSEPPQHATDLEALRAQTLARIDALAADARAGRVGPRTAYDLLSVDVRRFVAAASGRPADAMTLTDLRADGIPLVPDLLALLYPGQFGPHPDPDPRSAIASAREVVATWR